MKLSLFIIDLNEKKSKNIGLGKVSIVNGDASHQKGEEWRWLYRTKLEWISEETIKLSGFELVGYNPDRSKKYAYKEWVLRLPEEESF
ncbi:MAG: hypothetical protein AB1567_06915 [bacterium]